MRTILSIVFVLVANFAISQNLAPNFTVNSTKIVENSTLGGSFIDFSENDITIQQTNLVFIKEMNQGDFILLEINRNDKKKYYLELMNSAGEVIVSISDFNSSSFKIVKNNFDKGNYTVFLTEQETQKVDTGIVSL